MTLKEILSPTVFRQSCTELVSTHPFTLLWIAVSTVWGLLVINDVVDSSVITFGLFEGYFMSLAIDIWTDFLGKRRYYILLEALAILLVASDCLITSRAGGFDVMGNTVGHASLMTGLAVACFFVPISGTITNRTQTYFQLVHAAMCVVLAVVFLFATWLLLTLLRELFDIHAIDFDDSLLFICVLIVPATIFTAMQLTKAKADQSAPVFFGGGFCKFVLLPIVMVYFAILYIYLIKIMIVWELPNGEVTWMVTAQMVLVLVVLYGLRDFTHNPSASEANVTISRLAMRWLPIMMLPLLGLMTVGINYRLNQYGITADRIYVVCFLIWAYCVDIYLIIKYQKSNLNLVAISFAALFVAVSAIPGCNVTAITNSSLRAEIREALGGNKWPMTLEEAHSALAKLPTDEKMRIASKIEYLDSWHDHSQISDIVSHKERIRVNMLAAYDDEVHSYSTYYKVNDLVVPEGYTKFKDDRIHADDYIIDKKALLQASQEENPAQLNWYSNDSSRIAVITYAQFSHNDSVATNVTNIQAIVFYNK